MKIKVECENVNISYTLKVKCQEKSNEIVKLFRKMVKEIEELD